MREAYLRHSADDLHGHFPPGADVQSFHDLAKGALAEKLQQAVPLSESAVLMHDVVSIIVVNLVTSLVPLEKEER